MKKRKEVDPYRAPGAFSKRVVALALTVPPGRVTTYGALARAAGGGGLAAQSITTILGKAWEEGEKKIPFHRIVYADGTIWISPKYRKERMKRYKAEKIEVDSKNRIIDFRDKLFEFT